MRTPQAPTVAVVAVVATGLALVALVDWRPGAVVLSLAPLLAAGLRLVLTPARAGWLVVRSRAFDAALLLVTGLAMLVLTATIPRP